MFCSDFFDSRQKTVKNYLSEIEIGSYNERTGGLTMDSLFTECEVKQQRPGIKFVYRGPVDVP